MNNTHRQPLPIVLGTSNFKDIRENNLLYIDKTILIKHILDAPAKVLLLPRPRRFGKTLNLSTLHYFFEKSEEDYGQLFDGLTIRQDEVFQQHQGKYPVISMTFKDVKGLNWENVYHGLCNVIGEEIERHKEILQDDEKGSQRLQALLEGTSPQRDYEESLRLLSAQLDQHYGEKVIILIDEYDAPILSGYSNGYYQEIISFMRNFLSGGLKDNQHLFKGVLTGILRVAKESIFSGLNNLAVHTLLDEEFNACFGFTEEEVAALLEVHGLHDYRDVVSSWYNGYLFGGRVVYNPWSALNFIASKSKEPKLYWVNTGSPELIETLVTKGGKELRSELGQLMDGLVIEKPIEENIVMSDVEARDDLLWSFLLFTGYLKPVRHVSFETYQLAIPNQEVLMLYRRFVRSWFSKTIESSLLETMLHGLQDGDVIVFERMLRRVVTQIMSYHDLSGEPEKVYHALMLGMLVWLSGKYDIRSNRESGYGRYDVMLKPKDTRRQGIIIKFKRVYEDEKPETILKQALKQIEVRGYTAELEAAGIQNILKLAIAFQGKELWVKQG